jgi:hypothetical protein
MQKFKKNKFYKKKYKNNNKNQDDKNNSKELKFLFFGQNITKTEIQSCKNYKKKYFYKVNKKKKGILLNLPCFKNLTYPYPFNFKLINEMLKK